MRYTQGVALPTHLLYADDILVFCKALVQNIRNLRDALNYYGWLSGQLVNWGKKEVFFRDGVPINHRTELVGLIRVCIGKLPFNYLGALLFWGKPKAANLQVLLDATLAK